MKTKAFDRIITVTAIAVFIGAGMMFFGPLPVKLVGVWIFWGAWGLMMAAAIFFSPAKN